MNILVFERISLLEADFSRFLIYDFHAASGVTKANLLVVIYPLLLESMGLVLGYADGGRWK